MKFRKNFFNLKDLNTNSNSKTSDPIILSYDSGTLRKSDLDTLQSNQWLNDQILSFSFDILRQRLSKANQATRIEIVEPSMVHLLRQTSQPRSLRGVLSLKLEEAQFVFLPINDHLSASAGGNHWSLLIYARNENAFFHYDSLNNMNLIHARHTADAWLQFQQGNDIRNQNGSKSIFRSMRTPQQGNGSDCGVIVIAIVETLYVRLLDIREPYWTSPNLWNLKIEDIYPPAVMRQRLLTFAERFKKD